MSLRYTLRVAAGGVFVGFAALPTARAQPAPPVKPAISEEAAAAISELGRALSARDLSFTVKTIQVYLDESGQPLHIFHTMKIVARRPDRLAVRVTGDDGSQDLFDDGRSVTLFSPDSKEYAEIAASGDIPSSLNAVQEKLNVQFPLADFLTNDPDKSIFRGVIAGWQIGTANIDGIESRHLFFTGRAGIELELWVEKNGAAIPHRLIVTYRLLPGQPNFVAEFTDWNTQVHPSDSEFAFQPPAGAKKIELRAEVAPGQGESR